MNPKPNAVDRSAEGTSRAVRVDTGPQIPAPAIETTDIARNASTTVSTRPKANRPAALTSTAPRRIGLGPNRSTSVPATGEIASASSACHASRAVAVDTSIPRIWCR